MLNGIKTWHERLPLIPILFGGALIHAFANRFIQDDAFISFLYARNLVQGKGLTWCTGERVEGFSNFMWVLVGAVGEWLRWDIVSYSIVVGLCLFAGSLIIWTKISKLLFPQNDNYRLAFLFALFANHSWAAFATGGMETPLVTLLFSILFLLAVRYRGPEWSAQRLALFSLIFALGVLTRMDFVLLALPPAVYVFSQVIKAPKRARLTGALFSLVFPSLILLGAALLARYMYYGSWVPNTYWVKFNFQPNIYRTAAYFGNFVALTQLYFFIPALPYVFYKHRDRFTMLSAITACIWIIYLVKIGGDFMEFRHLVPILPLLYLVVLRALFNLHGRYKWAGRVVLALVIVIAPILHHYAEPVLRPRAMTITPALNTWVTDRYGWMNIGRILGNELPPHTRIAVTPAGAIPYYSGLYTIDMLGLNDRRIATEGLKMTNAGIGIRPKSRYGTLPGHARIGRYSYVQEKKINFLILHPLVIRGASNDELANETLRLTQRIPLWREFLPDAWQTNETLTFVLLPIHDRFLITLYCHQTDEFDQLIADSDYPRFVINRAVWLEPFLTE